MQRVTIDKRKDGVSQWIMQIDDDNPVPVVDLMQATAFIITYPENPLYWKLEKGDTP